MAYKSNTKKRSATNFIVVHCSATTAKQKVTAADVNRWHRSQGWQCIGYHYFIKRDGELEEGRDVDVIGSHVSGHNTHSVGICMAGGIAADGKSPENNYTAGQLATLKDLLVKLSVKYPKAVIQGHRDFPGVAKACPCFDVKAWVKEQGI
jgi:N-acetylmuramoyl-L-alanine amidase